LVFDDRYPFLRSILDKMEQLSRGATKSIVLGRGVGVGDSDAVEAAVVAAGAPAAISAIVPPVGCVDVCFVH